MYVVVAFAVALQVVMAFFQRKWSIEAREAANAERDLHRSATEMLADATRLNTQGLNALYEARAIYQEVEV
jgi:hypothetical protein